MPQTFDLDENDHLFHVVYTGTDGEPYKIVADVIEANDFLVDLGTKYENQFEQRHEIDQEMRDWAVCHGGKNMPPSHLLLLQGAIRVAFEEFKKKADQSLISQIFMESTPSTLDQLRDGRLKLASQESSPSENSEPDVPPATLPQTESSC